MSLFKVAETLGTSEVHAETNIIKDLLFEAKDNLIEDPRGHRKLTDNLNLRNTRRSRSLESEKGNYRSMSVDSDDEDRRSLSSQST